MTLLELQTQYEAKSKEQDGLLGRGQETTAEDIVRAEVLDGELRQIKEQIDTIARAERLQAAAKARQAEIATPGPSLPTGHLPTAAPGSGGSTFYAWQPGGTTEVEVDRGDPGGHAKSEFQRPLMSNEWGPQLLGRKAWEAIHQPDYSEAFWTMIRQKGFMDTMTSLQQKTLQEGLDYQGGFLVPEDFLARIIMKKPTPTRVANYVTRLNTTRDALTIPRVVYTTDDLNVGVAA